MDKYGAFHANQTCVLIHYIINDEVCTVKLV